VPHILCLAVEGLFGEAALLGLDRAGIAVHSGSACAAEAFEPSPVIEAIGADPDRSLRLSVGWTSSEEDVSAFEANFGRVVSELRSLAGSGGTA
jgi:cysteine desulfurase